MLSVNIWVIFYVQNIHKILKFATRTHCQQPQTINSTWWYCSNNQILGIWISFSYDHYKAYLYKYCKILIYFIPYYTIQLFQLFNQLKLKWRESKYNKRKVLLPSQIFTMIGCMKNKNWDESGRCKAIIRNNLRLNQAGLDYCFDSPVTGGLLMQSPLLNWQSDSHNLLIGSACNCTWRLFIESRD